MGAQPACGFRRKTIALADDLADIKQPVELGDFFLERHAAQQVGHAFGNGKGCVLVGVGHGSLDGLWGEIARLVEVGLPEQFSTVEVGLPNNSAGVLELRGQTV